MNETFLAMARSRMETYNKSWGEDDGTGIQCAECNNRGNSAMLTEDGNLVVKQCRCAGTRLTVKRLQRQGLFEVAKNKTLDTFIMRTETQKSLKTLVCKFLSESSPPWLLLSGQSGAGKTHLCTAAFVRLSFDRGMDGRYLSWVSDGRRMKASTKEGDDQMLNDFKRCNLLYIDDLFKCKRDAEPSDADIRMAYEILDYRYNHKLTTIISTELLPGEIRYLDEAIYRRIHEMCGQYIGNIGRDPSKCYVAK